MATTVANISLELQLKGKRELAAERSKRDFLQERINSLEILLEQTQQYSVCQNRCDIFN